MTRSIAILAALLSAAAPAVIRASDCPISEPFKTGEVKENEVVEASGLACSRRNPGVLYTHNDHNGDDDTAKIFAFLEDGEQVAELTLEGVSMEDFEDIAVGPGYGGDPWYVYVGDIGNNDYDRDVVTIYRFPEPDFSQITGEVEWTVPASAIVRYDVTTENSPDEDLETLLLDPLTLDLYLVSKNHDDDSANIYRYYDPPAEGTADGDVVVLPLVGNIAYEFLVAGDVSADGLRVLLRRGENHDAYMWFREPGQSIEEVLTTTGPCKLQLEDEEQGEAIAVDPDVLNFYTTSEGEEPPIYKYTFFL